MAPTIAFVTKKRDRSLFLLTHLIIKVKNYSYKVFTFIIEIMKHIHKKKNKILCDSSETKEDRNGSERGEGYESSKIPACFVYHYFTFHGHSSQTLCSHVATTLLRIHDPPIKLVAVVVTGLPRSAYIHVVADDEEAAASSMSAEGLSPSLFSANALVLRGLSLRRRRGPCARLFSPSSSNALHPPHATCLPTKLEKRRGSAGCVCFHLDPHTMCTRKDPTTRVPATFAIVYRATTVPQSCGGGCGGGNGDRLCELTRILHPETANEH